MSLIYASYMHYTCKPALTICQLLDTIPLPATASHVRPRSMAVCLWCTRAAAYARTCSPQIPQCNPTLWPPSKAGRPVAGFCTEPAATAPFTPFVPQLHLTSTTPPPCSHAACNQDTVGPYTRIQSHMRPILIMTAPQPALQRPSNPHNLARHQSTWVGCPGLNLQCKIRNAMHEANASEPFFRASLYIYSRNN